MRGRWQRVGAVLVALLIGALCFVYRFNTLGGPLAGFDNDHFFQIVRADAMLDGELPLRDRAEAELRSIWPPLTYAVPAMAMQTMGRTLRSEAILGVGMLAVGAAALYWTAAVVAQGILPAALLTLMAVGLSPTLYNYPKIVPYVLAVIAMLAYARRPTTWRLLAVAVPVVIATLYRHDHGVFLSVSVLVLMLLVHGRTAWRPLGMYAAFVLIGLLPGLIFVQQHGGVIAYLRDCLEMSRREAGRTVNTSINFDFDRSQPLLLRLPPPLPPQARIAVRWTTPATAAERAGAEESLGLSSPVQRGDETNWSYAIADPSPARLEAIVRDPRVADTDGIDRGTFSLRPGPPPPPARGWLRDWRVAPGILRTINATPWLVLVGWATVIASIGCLVWPASRRAVERPGVPSAFLAAVSALGVVLFLVFLRTPAPYRLPDVAVPVVVLGAWLLTSLPRAVGTAPAALRAGVTLVLTVIVVLSILSVGAVGTVPEQIAGMGVPEGATGVRDRWRTVWNSLGALPESLSGIDETLASAAGYIRRCSSPSDRLFVGDNVPELTYFARRGVAAGQSVFFGGFYTSETAQRTTIEQWTRQSVPIALVQPADRFEAEFGSDYPLLAEYLRSRYRRAGSLPVRNDTALDVWIDATRTAGADPATGLPCFAS